MPALSPLGSLCIRQVLRALCLIRKSRRPKGSPVPPNAPMCLECTGCTSDAYESILDLGFLYVPTRALSFYAVQAKAQCGLLIAKKKRPPTSISCSPITCSTVLPGHAVKVHPRVGWQLSPIRKQNFFFLIGEAKRASSPAFPLFTFFWSSALNSIIPFEPIQLYLSLLILIFLGRKPPTQSAF